MTEQNIAKRIIEKCGGAKVIASWLELTPKSIHCWSYSKDRGGSDGYIPSKYQNELIIIANKNGIKLTPSDFFNLRPR